MEEKDICSESKYNKELQSFKNFSLNFSKNPKKKYDIIDYEVNSKLPTEIFGDNTIRINNEEYHENLISNCENIQEDTLKSLSLDFYRKDLNFIFGKNKLGRKKKTSNENRFHNKYSSDNIIRKCKVIIINVLSKYINDKIKNIYQNDRSNIKILMKMNQSQIINSTVKSNQSFLSKKLKDIFSENISSRFNKYPIDHNRKLINDLLNEKVKEKRKFFGNLFNLTFIDCIKHLRGDKNINCLEGLPNIDEICKGIKGDEDYKESLRTYMDNFEIIINNKKSRKSREIRNK